MPGHDAGSRGEPLAEQLRPLAGRSVAIKDGDVLHDDATPQQLVSWPAEHNRKAGSVFRVPEDESAGTGVAPA
jgi:hypothetical protein